MKKRKLKRLESSNNLLKEKNIELFAENKKLRNQQGYTDEIYDKLDKLEDINENLIKLQADLYERRSLNDKLIKKYHRKIFWQKVRNKLHV